MDTLVVISAIVGLITGVGGLVVAIRSLQLSGKSIAETYRAPVRAAQHAILAELPKPAAELHEVLERVNMQLQEQPGRPAEIRNTAAAIEGLVTELSRRELVDPTLGTLLDQLRYRTFGQGCEHEGIHHALTRYAEMWEQRLEAENSPNDSPEIRHQLANNSTGIGLTMEPLRERCNALTPIVEQAQARLRIIDLQGLGNFPLPTTTARQANLEPPPITNQIIGRLD